MAFTPKEPTKEKPRTRKTTMSIIQKKNDRKMKNTVVPYHNILDDKFK